MFTNVSVILRHSEPAKERLRQRHCSPGGHFTNLCLSSTPEKRLEHVCVAEGELLTRQSKFTKVNVNVLLDNSERAKARLHKRQYSPGVCFANLNLSSAPEKRLEHVCVAHGELSAD
jgi:hypothetical protein